jgi:hypothetical protein
LSSGAEDHHGGAAVESVSGGDQLLSRLKNVLNDRRFLQTFLRFSLEEIN